MSFALMRQLARPIFFGMLVIIIAYLPLFAFQRIEYKLFSPMASAVGAALVYGLYGLAQGGAGALAFGLGAARDKNA